MTERPGIVDVHAHFLTPKYVAAARAAGILHPHGMRDWPAWSVDHQLASMNRRGISRAILSISSPGIFPPNRQKAVSLAESLNDDASELQSRFPNRLGFFATLPLPHVEDAVREARRAIDDLGASGVIVESHTDSQYLGDEDLGPLWAELDARGTTLVIHPAVPSTASDSSTEQLNAPLSATMDGARSVIDLIDSGVLTRFPNIQVLVTDCGAVLSLFGEQATAQRRDRIADWPAVMQSLWFDMSGAPFPREISAVLTLAGTHHLVYGSDSGWSPDEGIDRQLDLMHQATIEGTEGDWIELTTRNARALLSPLAPSS